eukprot:3096150-Amphidinium_carterae.4
MLHACLIKSLRCAGRQVEVRRTRALGLPAHVKTRIVKSLFSFGFYGAEVGGISDQHVKDLRASARGALGKGASLRRSAALELMAHGGPSDDPRVAADLSTVRVWQRRIAAGKMQWPLPVASWEGALELKLVGVSVSPGMKLTTRSAFNAALGGVWHEVRANAVFEVGEMCARCGEAVEDLEHMVHHCPAWRLHFRPPPSKRLLVSSSMACCLLLKGRLGAHNFTLCGPISSNPHFRRCGVGYYTDTGESALTRAEAIRLSRSRALAALPAGVRRVDRSDLQGNRLADVVTWLPTEVVRNFGLLVGPKLRVRPEQWPSVRLPSPEPVPEVVESERPVRFPAEPFVCGPHMHVVEHETYAMCLDCQRHAFTLEVVDSTTTALRGKPCKPLLRKKRAKLVPVFFSHVVEVDAPAVLRLRGLRLPSPPRPESVDFATHRGYHSHIIGGYGGTSRPQPLPRLNSRAFA